MNEVGNLIRSLSGRSPARNFHSFVINQIGIGIISGRFPVGSILPNDAAMIDEYGVSRTVLREALKTLEAKGLVEARPKVGTRVSPRSRWNLYDSSVLSWHFDGTSDRALIESLFDLRLTLEPRGAELAATRRTADNLRLLQYWLHQMEISLHLPEPFALAEFELHRLIADASHNPFHRSALGTVELAIAVTARASLAMPSPYDRAPTLQRHRTLLSAIDTAQPGVARACMEAIITDDLKIALLPGASRL